MKMFEAQGIDNELKKSIRSHALKIIFFLKSSSSNYLDWTLLMQQGMV